jgi:hypothetical protein
MFEKYVQNINPDEERFHAFISNYLAEKGVKEPEALAYSELYKVIKNGIREYLRQQEPRPRSET